MKGGTGDGIGHAPQSELVKAREEFFVVLVAKQAKDPLGRLRRAAAGDECQDQAREIAMVEPGGSLDCTGVDLGHRRTPIDAG